MKDAQNKIRFAIVTDERHTLATCVMLSQQGQNKQLKLLTYPDVDLCSIDSLNLFSLNSTQFMAWAGKVTKQKDEQVIFLAEEQIDANFRRKLRIDIELNTFMYPINDKRTKIHVKSRDISCGGIAIYSDKKLSSGEKFEIVIPCVETPIIVALEVLKKLEEGENLYACRFYDLIPQEEALIQESVFEYDLMQNRTR